MTHRPDDMTLREILDERREMIHALTLIAEAAEALKDPPEVVRHIGLVARRALKAEPTR